MNLTLKLDLPDAEQEAVWLNDRLHETPIDGLDSRVVENHAERGTMSGGMLANLLALVASAAAGKVVESLVDLIFRHFDGKRAHFELSGECPGSGKKFTLTFDNLAARNREKAMAEFHQLYADFCNPPQP